MRILVFGAGMQAVVNAIALRANGHRVHLYSNSNSFATGWTSDNVILNHTKYKIDRGIRIPALTHTSADEDFFLGTNFSQIDWIQFDSWVKEGCIAGEMSNYETNCIDIRSLGLDLKAGMNEIDCEKGHQCTSEEIRLRQTYGDTITQKFFKPLAKNRFGLSLSQMAPLMMQGLVPKRLVLCNSKTWEEKQYIFPKLTDIIATDTRTGLDEINHPPLLYPKVGFIDIWIRALLKSLNKKGIVVRRDVAHFQLKQNFKKEIEFIEPNSTEKFDYLVWTTGTVTLAEKLSIDKSLIPTINPVDFRVLKVKHMLFDKPPLKTNEVVLNLDLKSNSHRYIFWQNFRAKNLNENIITVETINRQSRLMAQNRYAAFNNEFKELASHGYLDDATVLMDVKTIASEQKMPIFSKNDTEVLKGFENKVKNQFENIYIPSKQGITFLPSIIREAYRMANILE